MGFWALYGAIRNVGPVYRSNRSWLFDLFLFVLLYEAVTIGMLLWRQIKKEVKVIKFS